jgi:hypothetical protein
LNAMGYSVGVEHFAPDHWVAYVFALPGCFSSGETEEQALSYVPQDVKNWFSWISSHAGTEDEGAYDFPPAAYQIGSVESFYAYPAAEDPEYIVNAFFEDDTQPLMLADIQDGLQMLEYTREDLLAVVKDLSPEILNKTMPDNDRFGSIMGILKHVAVVEWWYCNRMGLADFDWSALPEDPFRALEVIRANTVLRLPELVGDPHIIELVGERWSGRKILRRALWHERDHTQHILKLLKANS